MAFDSLAEKLQNVFKNLRGKGRLSEADVKAALKEVKMALLEADVNFKVVKNFVNSVQERAIGQDVLSSLTPAQMVIKIVNEEMIKLMGDETKGKKPLLIACDIYRPAAIEQLQINGEKQGVPVFAMGTTHKPVDIAKAGLEHAVKNGQNLVIIDTAGRLHIDEDMMNELIEIKEQITVDHTILVVDAMTGQDAVNVAQTFEERIKITGVILTKLDSDTRGGAALSIRAITGKPILYVGMGEKLSDLEQFYPDRMASRILGMGDVLTLIDKVQAELDEEKAKELEKKIKKADFDFNDYLDQFQQMKKMGGVSEIMKMLPGGIGSGKIKDSDLEGSDEALAKVEAIIYSMTKQERSNPDLLNPSRKKRIAAGAGVDLAEVNRVVKQFEQSKKMMKQFSGMFNSKGSKRKGFKLPFGL